MLQCKNATCKQWIHYQCTRLPLYQLYLLCETGRKFECEQCTEIPDKFKQKKLPCDYKDPTISLNICKEHVETQTKSETKDKESQTNTESQVAITDRLNGPTVSENTNKDGTNKDDTITLTRENAPITRPDSTENTPVTRPNSTENAPVTRPTSTENAPVTRPNSTEIVFNTNVQETGKRTELSTLSSENRMEQALALICDRLSDLCNLQQTVRKMDTDLMDKLIEAKK